MRSRHHERQPVCLSALIFTSNIQFRPCRYNSTRSVASKGDLYASNSMLVSVLFATRLPNRLRLPFFAFPTLLPNPKPLCMHILHTSVASPGGMAPSPLSSFSSHFLLLQQVLGCFPLPLNPPPVPTLLQPRPTFLYVTCSSCLQNCDILAGLCSKERVSVGKPTFIASCAE